jgi:hypothetical protein
LHHIRQSPDGKKLKDAYHVPNYGVSEETILRHIIANYDSLAGVTFFTQQSIGDRLDQRCLKLSEYLSCSRSEFVASCLPLSYCPAWKIKYFMTSDAVYDKGSSLYTLYSFSKHILGLSQDFSIRYWVPGSYFAIGKDIVHRKSRDYYIHVYDACDFARGNGIGIYNGSINEEVYFFGKTLLVDLQPRK